MRILITASRLCNEEHRPAIRRALLDEFGHVADPAELNQCVVVHGNQGYHRYGHTFGGDLIAHEEATALGMTPEPHPADWDLCDPTCKPGYRKTRYDGSEYCPTAGFRRNAAMVALGADVCRALPIGKSSGTRDCMRRAAGWDLACWCPLDDGEGNHVPCHADVLLRVANAEIEVAS